MTSSYPLYPDKHRLEAVFTPEAVLGFRRSLGRLPQVDPPESMLLCLYRSLPERMRRKAPLRRAGRLIGDLYFWKPGNGRVGVITNVGIGGPLAVSLVEELVAWGVRRLVSLQWAGGLQPGLLPGSVVIGERALRDEGASYHYLPAARTVEADPRLVESIRQAFVTRKIAHSVGTTWTTDAPYRETVAEVSEYQAEGVMTVEMEAAGLLAVAQARGVAAAPVFVVGDSLARLRWDAPADVRPIDRSLDEAYIVILEALGSSDKARA